MKSNKDKKVKITKITMIFLSSILILSLFKPISYGNLNIDMPIEKYSRITSPFGKRINPVTKKTSFHTGIDFGASVGTNLLAVESGIVIFSDFKGPYGYSIMIKGENTNLIYLYAHIDPNYRLDKNTIVTKGDIISKVGPLYIDRGPYKDYTGRFTNGLTTGPHLHFSVIKENSFVNPIEYIKVK